MTNTTRSAFRQWTEEILADELVGHADAFERRYEKAKQNVTERIAAGYLCTPSDLGELIEAQQAASVASTLHGLAEDLRKGDMTMERANAYILRNALRESHGSGLSLIERDAELAIWRFVARKTRGLI